MGRSAYSDLYYLMIWVDTLIAYVLFKLQRGIFICDRWIYDVAATFKYRGYHNKFIEKLMLMTPRPDLMVLLTLPYEIAFMRKRDDETIKYTHYRPVYYKMLDNEIKNMTKRVLYDAVVDSSRPVDIVAEDIFKIIKNHFFNKIHR